MTGYQAVVLAAGAARRFGGGKLLASWRGRPLVAAAVESALASPVDEVIVVLGCDAGPIAAALASLAGPRLRFARAQDWEEGLAASLRAGVASLPPNSRGFLLFLGDMPAIPAALPARVLTELMKGAPAVQPQRGTKPGHPVGFSRDLYEALSALSGDTGAGALLRARADVVRLPVDDPGSVLDIDHPDDLEAPRSDGPGHPV